MSFRGNYKRGERLQTKFDKTKSRTEQAHKQEVDINFILKRYRKTGILPVASRTPQFGDATVITDFHKSMQVVAQGKSEFAKLPAAERLKYKNDPKLWIESLDAGLKAALSKRAEDAKKADEDAKKAVPPNPAPNPPNDVK